MRFVLDASVALKWVLPEADSAQALRIRDDFQHQLHELIAPESFSLECAHSLSKKQRQGLIPDAHALWRAIMLDSPILVPSLPLMDRALAIAIQARVAVYDCVYIALAEHEHCEFLTADERLVRNLQPDFPFITSLASFM
jgi:predicted nucleic acid-binding protein